MLGLVSDTHGLVRPECLRALAGVDLILHAGDVGGDHVIDALRGVATVHAVYGNTDVLGGGLPATVALDVAGVSIHVSHGNELGSPTPARLVQRYGADVIVFGHTHRAVIERIGHQLVINPGAAGPARFHLVPSVGRLIIENGRVHPELVALV